MSHTATYVALVHYPVRDQTGAVVTTALTNLDIHDIARSCRTYGLGGYYIVHPVEQQRQMAARIVGHWEEDGRHDFRKQALAGVSVVATLEDCVAAILVKEGQKPSLIVTSARPLPGCLGFAAVRELEGPKILVLGTGFGLDDAVLAKADVALAPICGPTAYNHLSVRSACAILLDRLYGDRKD